MICAIVNDGAHIWTFSFQRHPACWKVKILHTFSPTHTCPIAWQSGDAVGFAKLQKLLDTMMDDPTRDLIWSKIFSSPRVLEYLLVGLNVADAQQGEMLWGVRNKQTENRVKPVWVLLHTCSPAWVSVSPSSVPSPQALVPHPSSVPQHVRMADRLSLATRRLREHFIDLCVEVVGVWWGWGQRWPSVVRDYPIETLSIDFDRLSVCKTEGKEDAG